MDSNLQKELNKIPRSLIAWNVIAFSYTINTTTKSHKTIYSLVAKGERTYEKYLILKKDEYEQCLSAHEIFINPRVPH